MKSRNTACTPLQSPPRTERGTPHLIVFRGLLLTAFGSAYYHLAPDNDRLVLDRVPMTIVFMPLVSALIAERSSLKVGFWLLLILTAVGVGSVIQWHLSVQRGAGDLRFFGAVQLYAVLALFAAVLLPPRYTRGSDLLVVAGLYVHEPTSNDRGDGTTLETAAVEG